MAFGNSKCLLGGQKGNGGIWVFMQASKLMITGQSNNGIGLC